MLAIALLSLPTLGCGGPEVKVVPLVRVRGVVTLDGNPLENAVVVFESPDGSFSFAQTDARGRYELFFDSETRGVTPGEKIVRIAMNRRVRGLNANDEGSPDDRAGGSFSRQPPEKIADRYNAKSTLTATVGLDSHTINFDLKS
jgi:hypothetical protein